MTYVEKDMFNEHVKRVRALEQAGIAPPDEWAAVRRRFSEFLAMKTPARQRLIEAIIDPDGEDIAVLRAAAFSEMSIVPAVNHHVKAGVLEVLVQVYAPVSRANYKKVATQFDYAATKFTAAADIVNPEALAESMVTEPQAQRTAWSQAPLHAGKLDALMPAMVAAAELCGHSIGRDERMQLPLVVDDRGVHRRKLWEAWDYKDARCGRWSVVLAVGAAIRAADLGSLHAYRRPKPLEQKIEQRGGLTITTRIDPEDQPNLRRSGPNLRLWHARRSRLVSFPLT